MRASRSRKLGGNELVFNHRLPLEPGIAGVERPAGDRLEEQLRLESERARLTAEIATAKESSGGTSSDSISQELTRVESIIRDIVGLIDDPATELSTVIRKNVEKAELDAYLKGILFSTGRNQKP